MSSNGLGSSNNYLNESSNMKEGSHGIGVQGMGQANGYRWTPEPKQLPGKLIGNSSLFGS